MNRLARWGAALFVLPVAACAGNPPPPPAAPPAPPPLASADAAFIQAAAQGGLAEIQAARLAQATSHNPKIKAYAAQMIADHSQNDDQLKQVATAKGVTLPTAPSDAQQQQMAALQGEKGRKFDRDYAADQVSDHTQMLQMVQAEAQNGSDPDLRKFAADTAPTVQSHLDGARALTAQPVGKGTKHMAHHHSRQQKHAS